MRPHLVVGIDVGQYYCVFEAEQVYRIFALNSAEQQVVGGTYRFINLISVDPDVMAIASCSVVKSLIAGWGGLFLCTGFCF